MKNQAADESTARVVDDYRWLTGPEAVGWLELAASSDRPLAALADQLRAALSPERAHLVLQQVDLRKRARVKFAAADQMFFTPLGLEQATDERVARYKAARFGTADRVFDLCSGIGGDLLALAARGEAVGFDRDPTMALVAEANGRVAFEGAELRGAGRCPAVEVRDVRQVDVGQCAAWHMDPDRRSQGRRTTRIALYEPPPETIDALLAQNPHASIKLASAAEAPAEWIERAELEWISQARECRQCVGWFGCLAQHPGQRRATVLGRAGSSPRTIVGVPCVLPAPDRRTAALFVRARRGGVGGRSRWPAGRGAWLVANCGGRCLLDRRHGGPGSGACQF